MNPPDSPADPSRAWLERCQVARRGVIANYFHLAVRNGAQTPAAVLAWVQQHLQHLRRRPYTSQERREECTLLLSRLQTEPQDARRYGAWVIAYEALPANECARRKSARAHVHRDAWMAAQPTTEKQLNYLHMLGHRTTAPLSKREASDLIDAILYQREDLL